MVYNDQNYLQISSNYKNLVFLGKGSVNFTKSHNDSMMDGSWFSLQFNSNELIAFHSSNPNAPITSRGLDHTDGTIHYYNLTVFGPAGINTTITYYRFGIKAGDVASGSHFEIYNADGVRIFSDNEKYLNIIETKTGIIDVLYPWYASISDGKPLDGTQYGTTYALGKKLAVIYSFPTICAYNAWFQGGLHFGFPDNYCNCIWWWNYNSRSTGYDGFFNGEGSVEQYFNYLVVDVTNL